MFELFSSKKSLLQDDAFVISYIEGFWSLAEKGDITKDVAHNAIGEVIVMRRAQKMKGENNADK